jgi:hypothetical protein
VLRQLDDNRFDEQIWNRETLDEGDAEIPDWLWDMRLYFLGAWVDDKGVWLGLGELGEEYEGDSWAIDRIRELEGRANRELEGASLGWRAAILLIDVLLRAKDRELRVWRIADCCAGETSLDANWAFGLVRDGLRSSEIIDDD